MLSLFNLPVFWISVILIERNLLNSSGVLPLGLPLLLSELPITQNHEMKL